MDFFSVIPEAQGIVHVRGVYRQVPLYVRGGRVYAKFGAGFVRLNQGGACSAPNIRWADLDTPLGEMQTNVLHSRFKADDDERHICPMPLDLIERCLTLYSNPGDLVLDPFNGIGSTGYQAIRMGRRYLGVELKPEYAAQADRFLRAAEEGQHTYFSEEAVE